MPARLVVVFDTNVLIPLSIEASRSTRLFSRLQKAGHRVAISPQIRAEAREKMLTKQKLRTWLKQSDEEIETFIHDLGVLMHMTPGTEKAAGTVPADPKDEIIIAAALECEADYIISEDHHLLDLKGFQGIKIMNLDQFNAELDRLGVP